jgi:hypothetical protein
MGKDLSGTLERTLGKGLVSQGDHWVVVAQSWV